MTLTIACLLAYLIGGIPLGWLLVRHELHGLDIRLYGSGNVGAANVYRHSGLRLAAVVGVAQFLLGAVTVVGARLAHLGDAEQCLVGVCAAAGNGWPAYLRFNGGRAVAVATGVTAVLTPLTFPVLLVCYAVGAVERQLAAGVLTGFAVAVAIDAVVYGSPAALAAAGLLVIIVLRRLEGIGADAHAVGWTRRLVLDRVVHDRRPGRPLAGPRTDPGGQALRASAPRTASHA